MYDIRMARPNIDLRTLEQSDWTKVELDLTYRGNTIDNAADLLLALEADGTSVEHFKSLPSYTAALESGRYPWLSEI